MTISITPKTSLYIEIIIIVNIVVTVTIFGITLAAIYISSVFTAQKKLVPIAKHVITQAPVHINDFRGVRARYVKRTAQRSSDRNAQVKGQQPLWHRFVYLNVWHYNDATIVATIATTS